MILVNEYGQKKLVANIVYAFSIFFKNPLVFRIQLDNIPNVRNCKYKGKLLKKKVKNNILIKS